MPDASVNIGGNAAGAVAAVQEAQSAINSLSGKTVTVDVNVRQSGAGNGGVAGLARDLGRAATAAERINRAGAGGFGAGFERAGRSARGMADDFQRAGVRVAGMAAQTGRAADRMRTMADHSERAGKAITAAAGARGLAQVERGAISAGRQMLALESGAGRAAVAVRNIAPTGSGGTGGAIRDMVIDMNRLEDGTWAVGRAMKAIGSGSGATPFSWAGAGAGGFGNTSGMSAADWAAARARRRAGRSSTGGDRSFSAGGAGGIPAGGFSWSGVGTDDFGDTSGVSAEDWARARARNPRTGKPKATGPGAAEQLSTAKAAREAAAAVEEESKASEKAAGSTRKLAGASDGLNLHHIERAIRPMQEMGFQLAMVSGAMAGVAHEASNMMTSTTGMGLNFKGMSEGITLAEQSAARAHNLGLNGLDQQLRQTARSMVGDLAPAMRAGVAATKAWETAGMRSQAAMGPDLENFAKSVERNSPAIQSEMAAIKGSVLSVGSAMADAYGSPQAQQGIAGMAQGIRSNAPGIFSGMSGLMSYAQGTYSAPSSLLGRLGATVAGINPIAALGAMIAGGVGGARGGSGGGPTPSGFDPSKPYSGWAPGLGYGSGDTTAPSPAPSPSAQSQRYAGMSAQQIYESQYRAATGYASSGAGRPDQFGGPTSATLGSGFHPGAAPVSHADTGADLGQAMVKHVQKAVQIAAPEANAGGGQLGGLMTGGMAQGITSTQTVTDTAIIKHLKHVQDVAAGPAGIDARSPSEKYRHLFRNVPAGMASGIADGMYHPTSAMDNALGQMQAAAADQADDFGTANDPDRAGLSVSVKSNASARQYSDQVMSRIQAHNDRAAALAQSRAALHESALTRAGVAGHGDPLNNRNPFSGQSGDPFAQRQSLWQKAGSFLGARASGAVGPQNDLASLKGVFAQHGSAMAQGVVIGLSRGQAGAQAQMSTFSKGLQTQHKRDNGISSPSTVYAGFGSDMAAGVGVGFGAGTSAAAGAMTAAAAAMSASIAGPLNNQGLMLGYSYAKNIVTGATETLKTANFQGSGTPNIANSQAAAALGAAGELGPGAGASIYKTPTASFDPNAAVAPMAAALAAVLQSQPIQLRVDLDGQPFRQMTVEAQHAVLDAVRDSLVG